MGNTFLAKFWDLKATEIVLPATDSKFSILTTSRQSILLETCPGCKDTGICIVTINVNKIPYHRDS